MWHKWTNTTLEPNKCYLLVLVNCSPQNCLMNIGDIWTYSFATQCIFIYHFIKSQCLYSESELQHLKLWGFPSVGDGLYWLLFSDTFPSVFVVICYFVELHMWESWGPRLGNSDHPWVLSLLFILFQRNLYFYCSSSFIKVEVKELCLDSLYHHYQRERERTYNNHLTVNIYFEISSSFSLLFIMSHSLGWCPEENT